MHDCSSHLPHLPYHKLSTNTLPVAVLAAGLSTRFGAEDKLVQRFPSGISVAQKTLMNIQKARSPQHWFVRPHQLALMKQLRQAHISSTRCPKATKGLSTTLRYACEHYRHKRRLLITLADKPYIAPRFFQRFALMKIKNAIALIIARHQAHERWQHHTPKELKALTGYHPVLLNKTMRPQLKILQKDQGIAALLHQYSPQKALHPKYPCYPKKPFLQPMASCDISQKDIDIRSHLQTTPRGSL